MNPPVLTEEEIEVNRKRREHAKDYIQLLLKIDNCEPNDANVNAYLDLQEWSDATEYE